MGKKDKALEALIRQMQAQIAAMQNPASNPAQQYLTNEALAGADWLKKGEYRSLPKGMFFNFKQPTEQLEQYKKYADVNQGGTFALSDNSGMGKAGAIQKNYLTDKFARDASQNYQDNITGAAHDIRGALHSAADAKGSQDSRIFGALQGIGGVISSMPNKVPWWQKLLGGVASGLSYSSKGGFAI